ncbi:unnamed protein product [Oppiella nova]|uniref:Uncharacterized protein n=1 Tax=Oppiella nova TaxID=334625 RepID=A0A7R9MF79_9ACAR|nr:unnamed protein product [Oppiella nova]CAG2176242.1 unnamed protein product [Oppiella nova]
MTPDTVEFIAVFVLALDTVRPAPIKSGFYDNLGLTSDELDAIYEQMPQQIPLGRMVRPIENANAVLFIASRDSSFVTGSTLVCEGGFLLQ